MEAAGLIGGASPRLRRASVDGDVEAELLDDVLHHHPDPSGDLEPPPDTPWSSEAARVWELAWPSILTSLLEFLPTPLNLLAIGHFGSKDDVAAFALVCLVEVLRLSVLGSSVQYSHSPLCLPTRVPCLATSLAFPSVWDC